MNFMIFDSAAFVQVGTGMVLVHNTNEINLGDGYTGRVDTFNMAGNVDFEIHVFENGREVGVWGSDGWFSKHGHGTDVAVPGGVENRLKGESVDIMRNTGRLGPKGTVDITGDKWQRPRLGGC